MTRPSAQQRDRELLLGEWACLGILYSGQRHGFAVAASLKPEGEVGRVWSLSRALTYRSLDQLGARGLVRAVGEERGIAGGNRTVLAATRAGRAQLRGWLATPVEHLRDLRSELLLKLVIAEMCGVDITDMLRAQRARVADLAASLAQPDRGIESAADPAVEPAVEPAVDPAVEPDLVAVWRRESTEAALRFLDHTLASHIASPNPNPVCAAVRVGRPTQIRTQT